ncbi:MAG: hypothetical protein PSX36_05500 [bacterium]|nr:hypothetical protein [bacterium]
MSKTFTYEIDERRLRLQLRDVNVPLKEDAWDKFEVYAQAHPLEQPKHRFTKFELKLSRNVLLPLVFGGIICVFSFLLFNFISIKKPIGQTEPNENPVPSKAIQHLPAQEFAPTSVKVATAAEKPATMPESSQTTDQPQLVETQATSHMAEQTKQEASAPDSAKMKVASTVNQDKISEPSARPKRKKDPDQSLSEIKPNAVSDEEEVEVVPN